MEAREIVERYTRRGTSVSVLAELNNTSTDAIRKILLQEGVNIPPAKPKKKTGPKPKAKEEPVKIPKRLAAYHQIVINEIQEEIEVHINSIAEDEQEIREKTRAIKKEIDKLAKSIKDYEQSKKAAIEEHKKALEVLGAELEEEKQFYKKYSEGK
jgi:flagellar capping protein FliD